MLWPGLVIDINTNVINLRLSCIVAKFTKQRVQSRKDQIDIIGHLFNLILTIGISLLLAGQLAHKKD